MKNCILCLGISILLCLITGPIGAAGPEQIVFEFEDDFFIPEGEDNPWTSHGRLVLGDLEPITYSYVDEEGESGQFRLFPSGRNDQYRKNRNFKNLSGR